jgi:GxxExxY protein
MSTETGGERMYLHSDLTERIISCFYEVYNRLGYGFLEKVYERALLEELRLRGIAADAQVHVTVRYKGRDVGDYAADIVVEETVLVELKAAEAICDAHEAQLINYLHATNLEVGLILNFGKKPEVRRRIFTNDRKLLPSV